ncbi:FecCD family ABC transporter permease [Actinoplanes sp. G11-F43]|uniref:FecCD family ABC transporter permease n=1 Tax=Actinoplanes sp. G11-F43 TaxID=3424130 RepID=UPI003D357BC4
MRITTTTERLLVLVPAIGLLIVAVVAGISVGARTVPPGEVWRAFTDYAGTDDHLIVRDIRLPRTLTGLAIGAALGMAGALVQTLTRNPLAEPGLLGVTAGAGFAINLGMVAGVAGTAAARLGLALAGCAAAAVLVFAIGRTAPLRLVLAGVALSAVLSGLSLGMRLVWPDVLDGYRFWSVGALAGVEQTSRALPVIVLAVALAGALLVARPLGVMMLGDEAARALGAHVIRTRVAVLVIVTLLAGAATAVAGPIAFAGLMVPHLARRFAGGSVPWLAGFSLLFGPVLLVAADVLARLLLPTGEVPVAIVTAFLGAPVLIWAVRRYGARSL